MRTGLRRLWPRRRLSAKSLLDRLADSGQIVWVRRDDHPDQSGRLTRSDRGYYELTLGRQRLARFQPAAVARVEFDQDAVGQARTLLWVGSQAGAA